MSGNEFVLTRDNWDSSDGESFQRFLTEQSRPDKIEWTKRILNTSLPVLAIPTAELKDAANKIAKGNYRAFLDLKLWEYYENTAINGILIPLIKDFSEMKVYLDDYAKKADNWASCDVLKIRAKNNTENIFALAEEYALSDLPFQRRIGTISLFSLVSDSNSIDRIFAYLDGFSGETEYYVNMANAWLVCECFTKQREKTLDYLSRHKLNAFTVNKAVQKCRDSYRISDEDKAMLLFFKVKA